MQIYAGDMQRRQSYTTRAHLDTVFWFTELVPKRIFIFFWVNVNYTYLKTGLLDCGEGKYKIQVNNTWRQRVNVT